MVDDKLLSVHYGIQKLEWKWNGKWDNRVTEKTFAFHPSDGVELRVEAKDNQNDGHCQGSSSFILYCEAKYASGQKAPENPWHGFVSNTNSWKSEGGTELCNVTLKKGWDEKANKLTSLGASHIWAKGKQSVLLVGSPYKKYNY